MTEKEPEIDYNRLAKSHRTFFFKDITRYDMMTRVNQKYPINLKHNEDLIDRVAARYPLLNKMEVALIIKNFFQAVRDLLILGKVLSFDEIFINAKLFVSKQFRGGEEVPNIKIKIQTSKIMKNL